MIHLRLRVKINSFFKSQFILQSVVLHLAECYGERVLQCLGEKPYPQIVGAGPDRARGCVLKSKP
jgi:hypothetical protein